jgi:hypothetical protein
MKAWKVILTIGCAAFILAGTTAYGADLYFYHSGGGPEAWSSSYWYDNAGHTGTPGGPPSSSESAQIDTDCYLTANAECASVTVSSGIQLELADSNPTGYRLDVYGASTSTVNGSGGKILLSASASDLRFHDTHTITGVGVVEGTDNSAKITIASGKTLTSVLDTLGITGHLEITDATSGGSFTNQGIVEANGTGSVGSPDILKISVTGTLDDSSGNRWKATAAYSVLQFDSSLMTISTDGKLSGNFVISSDATAEIENHKQCLITDGYLSMSNGVLDVQECLIMGCGASSYMNVTGGQIDVTNGKSFYHY